MLVEGMNRENKPRFFKYAPPFLERESTAMTAEGSGLPDIGRDFLLVSVISLFLRVTLHAPRVG